VDGLCLLCLLVSADDLAQMAKARSWGMALAKAKVKGNAEARGVAMAVARFAELLDEAGRKEMHHIETCIAAVCLF